MPPSASGEPFAGRGRAGPPAVRWDPLLARVLSATLQGIEAILLSVECDLAPGIPQIHTIGLPDAAVRESADRVRAALRNAGFPLPPRRITINLAPADVRKQGAALDLPIALGILAAGGHLPQGRLARLLVLGELALDGAVRRVPGVLPVCLRARGEGIEEVLVPAANREEALAIPGPMVHAVATLADAVRAARGDSRPERASAPVLRAWPAPETGDFAEVRGQTHARRAIEIAAAGGHHLLMIGPPGCGKTMLARRLPGILPPPSLEEAIEITCIYSAAGLLAEPGLVGTRPFRAPHHTISGAGLVGGGRGPRPGEVTLAHRGVLFLDELAEFGRGTLDVLRQPLEEGAVIIRRVERATRLPARFTLVAAMNPCPCGHLGRSDRPCACTPGAVAVYRGRVSGPLLDRFDLQIEVPPLRPEELADGPQGDASATIAARVGAARRRQAERLAGTGIATNAALTPELLRRHAAPGRAGRRLLEQAARRLQLSARAHDSILKIGRTIADLDGTTEVGEGDLAQAVQLRLLDRPARAE